MLIEYLITLISITISNILGNLDRYSLIKTKVIVFSVFTLEWSTWLKMMNVHLRRLQWTWPKRLCRSCSTNCSKKSSTFRRPENLFLFVNHKVQLLMIYRWLYFSSNFQTFGLVTNIKKLKLKMRLQLKTSIFECWSRLWKII